MVSTTAWQSFPAVNPGPAATTAGAMSMVVPRFRLARMTSATASGFRLLTQRASGSMRTGMIPSASSAGTSSSTARRAETPSTAISPRRTASEKQTVRRMEVGAAVSHRTASIPARYNRSAVPVARSPPPRITTSMSSFLLSVIRRTPAGTAAPPDGGPLPAHRLFPSG